MKNFEQNLKAMTKFKESVKKNLATNNSNITLFLASIEYMFNDIIHKGSCKVMISLNEPPKITLIDCINLPEEIFIEFNCKFQNISYRKHKNELVIENNTISKLGNNYTVIIKEYSIL